MYITDYFRQIDQVILDCPAIISKELLFDQRTKYIGFLKGTVSFRDGSELHFKEFIDTEARITKYKYGYHYQKDDRLIFRYDNHPHPARKDTPSHHKHVSYEDNVVSASIPGLEDVLKEVVMYLP
ncbi:MAG: DUF6516 family protein [Thermodesulfobacteriota bacterium]|nr:DUF6516 family protein [Thermodesulfobacteriota bacterium]